jgi:hypothetical protein
MNGFARAWHRWMHTPAPVENSRRGRSRAESYGAELRLDHLASSIYGLGLAFQEGRKWDFEAIAADRLRELHEAETELDGVQIPADRRATFDRWIDATRNLLHAVSGCAG